MGVSNRTLNKMVFKTLSTALLLLPFITGQPPPPEECCEMKMVGDFEYRFMMEGMPGLPASCMNACIYKRVDNGKMYCFAPGDLHVECEDEDVTDAPDGGEDSTGNCTCGITKNNRVVGGVETEVNQYPWMVGILDKTNNNVQLCGGSLIASRFVLTASHCFADDDPTKWLLVLGEHNLYETGETELETKYFEVEKVILHANYDFPSNDIALLVLAEEVDISIYNTVCLPDEGEKFAGQNALVYGWGALEFDTGSYPDTLQEVELPVKTHEECLEQNSMATEGKMLCAGGVLGEDACQGDSGGPLSVETDGQHELIGVVSGGMGCGDGVNIGFFAEVSSFIDWIADRMAENGDSESCAA